MSGDDEGFFQNVELYPGDMIAGTEDYQSTIGRKKKTYNWEACTSNDCLDDMSCFLGALTEKLSTKFEEVVQEKVKLLAVIDLEALSVKFSEFSISNGVFTISRESQIDCETFRATEFKIMFSFFCRLQHLQNFSTQNPDLNLSPHDHEMNFFWEKSTKISCRMFLKKKQVVISKS